MNAFYRFMAGRYGMDELNRFLIIVSMVCVMLSILFRGGVFSVLSSLLILLYTFRLLSRNAPRRQHENRVYLSLRGQFVQFILPLKKRWQDRRTHRYFRCPKCNTTLRVPRNRGKIRITCRSCQHQFERVT